MTKKILIILIALVAAGALWYVALPKEIPNVVAPVLQEETEGKLKVANFSGPLEEVNVGCYVDGECYVVVGGKHVTAVLGWRQEVVGSVQGVESFGDLEKNIGKEVEVYAKDKGDGTYTLYGSEGFYIKVLSSSSVSPKSISLVGKQICLSHRIKTGPQTLECATGFRTDDGVDYALNLNLMSSTDAAALINSGARVRVQGVITPTEMLSSDHWQRYDMKGILSVTSAQKI